MPLARGRPKRCERQSPNADVRPESVLLRCALVRWISCSNREVRGSGAKLSREIRIGESFLKGQLVENTLAVVLAGGEGRRLGSLTRRHAKPAVPIAGHYRNIDFALSNAVNSGIRRIGVLTSTKPIP